MGRYIGRGLDRATRPVAPTLSPDEYDGNGRIMGNFNINMLVSNMYAISLRYYLS